MIAPTDASEFADDYHQVMDNITVMFLYFHNGHHGQIMDFMNNK